MSGSDRRHRYPVPSSGGRDRRSYVNDGGRFKTVEALLVLAAVGVMFGAGIYGMREVWVHRVELGKVLLRGISWAGVHAFQAAKTIGKGLARALCWGGAWAAKVVKAAAIKAWKWLRGSPGESVAAFLSL